MTEALPRGVWLYTRKSKGERWTDGKLNRAFARVPAVGEYISTEFQGPKFVVEVVLHIAFAGGDSDAEVYATEIDDSTLLDK